jgi:hypothetical protein
MCFGFVQALIVVSAQRFLLSFLHNHFHAWLGVLFISAVLLSLHICLVSTP